MIMNDIALYLFLSCVYSIPAFGLVSWASDKIRGVYLGSPIDKKQK